MDKSTVLKLNLNHPKHTMLHTFNKHLLIEIFKHVPATDYTQLALTTKTFLPVLRDETLWKQYTKIDMSSITGNYFEFAKAKLKPHWKWNTTTVRELQNGFQTFAPYPYCCATTDHLTPAHPEVSFMLNFEEPKDHFQVGLYESHEMNDMCGFTFVKAISYIKGNILYPNKKDILSGSELEVQRLKPMDFITFKVDFDTKIVSVLINNESVFTVDVSDWKVLYSAKGLKTPTQVKFYYFK